MATVCWKMSPETSGDVQDDEAYFVPTAGEPVFLGNDFKITHKKVAKGRWLGVTLGVEAATDGGRGTRERHYTDFTLGIVRTMGDAVVL